MVSAFVSVINYFIGKIKVKVQIEKGLRMIGWIGLLACIHFCQVVIIYLIMLAVMTYNTGFFFGVISGLVLGYVVIFVFSFTEKKENLYYQLQLESNED